MGQKVWKLTGRLLNVPAGTGILFGSQARRRLLLAVLGSLVMAAIEVASVTAVVPLMQLVTELRQTRACLVRWASSSEFQMPRR